MGEDPIALRPSSGTSATRTGTRDLYRAGMCPICGYQAAWQLSPLDIYGRIDMSAVIQEERSVGLKDHPRIGNSDDVPYTGDVEEGTVTWLRNRSYGPSRFGVRSL
ncbi:MAG: hypothetical protein ACRDTA_15090 [Pseudonocardiaceae bacterium]